MKLSTFAMYTAIQRSCSLCCVGSLLESMWDLLYSSLYTHCLRHEIDENVDAQVISHSYLQISNVNAKSWIGAICIMVSCFVCWDVLHLLAGLCEAANIPWVSDVGTASASTPNGRIESRIVISTSISSRRLCQNNTILSLTLVWLVHTGWNLEANRF